MKKKLIYKFLPGFDEPNENVEYKIFVVGKNHTLRAIKKMPPFVIEYIKFSMSYKKKFHFLFVLMEVYISIQIRIFHGILMKHRFLLIWNLECVT